MEYQQEEEEREEEVHSRSITRVFLVAVLDDVAAFVGVVVVAELEFEVFFLEVSPIEVFSPSIGAKGIAFTNT